MKFIGTLFLLQLLFAPSQAQRSMVSAFRNNTLYIGLDNPLTIIAENYTSSNLEIHTNKGTVTGYAGTWIYRGIEPGEVLISLFDKLSKKEIGKFSFIVTYIPNPIVYLGNVKQGNIDKLTLESQPSLEAKIDDFGFDVRFTVKSFSIRILRDSILLYKQENAESLISTEISRQLKEVKSGDLIIFNKILALSPDNRKVELQSAIFSVTN